MRRPCFLALAAALAALAVPSAADALRAPSLASPRNGASVQQLPAFTWNSVRGAAAYEYQVSSNVRFHSLIGGSGTGRGTAKTPNLAAALEKNVADGTYYWRVRALTAHDQTGPWSRTRRIVKRWTSSPTLTGGLGVNVNWPTTPLVLRWSSVPYATKYIVTIATDPGMANIVLGSKTKPVETQAISYAVPVSLAPRAGASYFWAITPVDADGHRGTQSAAGSFTWTWPTATATYVTDLNPGAGVFDDPLFSWAPIPGAARYEVEVSVDPGFAAGSRFCCTEATTGTSLAPLTPLANLHTSYWRVRAIDAHGNVGEWNEGPPIEKVFDPSTPSVPGLKLINVERQELTPNPTPGTAPETDTPIVVWKPVPGASRYEVELGPYSGGICDWTKAYPGGALEPTSPYKAFTSTTAWTPLGVGGHVGQTSWPTPQHSLAALPAGGTSYCFRVLARSDDDAQGGQVTSTWTQLNGPEEPAFTYVDRSKETEELDETEVHEEEEGKRSPCAVSRGPITERGLWSNTTTYARADEVEDQKTKHIYISLTNGNVDHEPSTSPSFWSLRLVTPSCGYISPNWGTGETLTPFFTWKRVVGAKGYYVVIARDARFTEVVDVGFTNVPAYAPREFNESPLADEATYFWAVMPTEGSAGAVAGGYPCYQTETNPCTPFSDNPRPFAKSSIPPALCAPGAGERVPKQPTFEWAASTAQCEPGSNHEPVANARTYRLQVALDPTFGHLIADVTTAATAYTSTTTYPTNTPLYWRVRANDWLGQGLNWSGTQKFERVLPTPTANPFDSSASLATTPLTWGALEGAISYDVHIEQADGTARDYSFEAPAASAVEYYGSGFGYFEVRGEFPGPTAGASVPGPYSSRMQLPGLTLSPPPGARGVRSGSRLLVTWKPEQDATRYRVEVATSNGFRIPAEAKTIDGTSWAPDINLNSKQYRRTLYWRVAAVDKRGGVGSFASGVLAAPRSHRKKH